MALNFDLVARKSTKRPLPEIIDLEEAVDEGGEESKAAAEPLRISVQSVATPQHQAKDYGTITISFGDCVENNVGMAILGTPQAGLSSADLERMRASLEALGCGARVRDLHGLLGVEGHGRGEAKVLVARQALAHFGVDAGPLGRALSRLPWDTKAYMKGRVVNKRARHNLCFASEDLEPDYEGKRGRVVAVGGIAALAQLKSKIDGLTGRRLLAEGNHYYDGRSCYIGYHGDSERNLVVGCRFGQPMYLRWQAFHRSKPISGPFEVLLREGDLYAMTTKAQGIDWRSPSILPTFRHAASFEPSPTGAEVIISKGA